MEIEKYLESVGKGLVNVSDMIRTLCTLTETEVTEITENDFCTLAGTHCCDFCGKYFVRKSDLEEHKRLVMYEEELEERFSGSDKL